MAARSITMKVRLSPLDAAQLDADRRTLGLATRSDAVREALRLLHREARRVALAADYDQFRGGGGADGRVDPVSSIGHVVAADTIARSSR